MAKTRPALSSGRMLHESCAKKNFPYPFAEMNLCKKPLVWLLLSTLGAIFSGCASHSAKDSSIPWSRPANWEGQMPGMPSQGMGR